MDQPLKFGFIPIEGGAYYSEFLEAEKHLMISYRDEYGGGKWKHLIIGSTDAAPVDQFEALSRDRFIVGSAETVIRQIQRFQETFRMDHLICRLYFPGLPRSFIMNEIHILAKEVLPVFQRVVP
jgi:alkanesulfonate monooxygenase SsuD/methylene tetrahydromethanopterin reductase-like flavin-dependent oxidoreductase (luciferase family)